MARWVGALVSVGALVAAVACGSSEDPASTNLGARCSAASQCGSGTCITSGDFPGGLCTKRCSAQADCPDGWACATDSSGICLQKCSAPSDCASYGAEWSCREESLQGSSAGKAMLCSGR